MASLLVLTVLLTSCSAAEQDPISSRPIGIDEISNALKLKAYAQWDAKFPEQSSSWNDQSSKSPASSLPGNVDVQSPGESAPLSIEEVDAWRKEEADKVEQIPRDQLTLMCELFFENFLQPEPDDTFRFAPIVDRLKASGLTPYSLEKVSLVEDNRETMKYPTKEQPSFMFVCGANMKFRDAVGQFKRAKVYISWAFLLVNGVATFNFPYVTYSLTD